MNVSEYTGAQRLFYLFRKLNAGEVINPTRHAAHMGIKRQSVYHQIKLLKKMNIKIEKQDTGQWYLPEPVKNLDVDINELTGAQRLVYLGFKMESGDIINPTIHAATMDIRRQSVYHQFVLLGEMGIDLFPVTPGQWTLLSKVTERI